MLGIVGSLLGSVASGVMGMFGQNSANQQNQANMMEQERFATDMSNTAYQRSSADMTKAGLNPSAMFGSGAAASTPGVQQPFIQNSMAPMAQATQQAVASATQQMVAQKTIDNLVTQNAGILADVKLKDANTAATLAGNPAIASNTQQTLRKNAAISAMPDKVYTPLVQGGFGADSLKNTTFGLGADVGAAAASAKSVGSSVSDVVSGISGPVANSAGSVYRSIGDWFTRGKPNPSSTFHPAGMPYRQGGWIITQ